jgi:hypothetical protein
MSFITSQVTYNGIIFTADRCMLAAKAGANGKPESPATAKKRNHEKLFVTKNNIGIASYGAASINGHTAERHMYEFINGLDIEKCKTPFDVAQQLRDYIRRFDPKMEAVFNVGGYDFTDPKKPVPKLWGIDIPNNTIDLKTAMIFYPVPCSQESRKSPAILRNTLAIIIRCTTLRTA